MADLERWLTQRTERTPAAHTRPILRGDLRSQDLSEVFVQVLATGQAGILRLTSRVEHRDLYFCRNRVQVFAPNRPGKRLAECLLHLQLLDSEQMEEALRLQQIFYKPLGVILLEKGFATEEDIDRVAEYQAREELYALFTWRSARFEFFQRDKHAPDTVERLKVMPAFEVKDVLTEVDRRKGRWQRFLHTLQDLDDVFETAGTAHPEQMTDEHRALLEALREGRSVNDVANETVYSVFDCARLMTDMLGWGVIRRTDAAGMVRLAREQLEQGKPRPATLILQTLLDRDPVDFADTGTAAQAAELLLESGEPRQAAIAFVHAARLCTGPEEALALARRAHSLDDRCKEALRCMQELLAVHGDDPEELFRTSCRLSDAASEEGDHEESFAILEDLLAERPQDIDLLQRGARILLRLERNAEASDMLLRAAAVLEKQGMPEPASTLYNQVLRLDPKSRDARKALSRIRFRSQRRLINVAAAAAAACVLLMVGLPMLGHSEEPAQPLPVAVRNDQRVRVRQVLNEAEEALRANDLSGALAAWGEARALRSGPEVAESARKAIAPLLRKLEETRERLLDLTVQSEDPLESARLRDRLLKGLSEQNRSEALALGGAVQQVRGDERLVQVLGKPQRDRMVKASEDVLQALAVADEIRQRYLQEKDLEWILAKAIRHEENHEFGEALEAYRALLSKHPGSGELQEDFRRRVAHYERIEAGMERMEQAVEAFDFAAARSALKELKELDPDIPFEKFTRLPIILDSLPSGASVFLNGEPAGETPTRATYRPDGELRVEWRMEGYERLVQTFVTDRKELAVVLTKLPDWKAVTRGTLEQRPVCDGEGRVFVTDRTGRITALSSNTGEVIWTLATGDLSGLLPRPLVHGDRLLVASLDGVVRALDRSTGQSRWQVDGLPCERPPALCGDTLLLVTDDDRVLGLRADSGQELFRRVLADAPASGIRAMDSGRGVFTTIGGEVVCLSSRDGSELWRARLGNGCSHPPAVGADRIAAVSDDGRLAVFGFAGDPVWRREAVLVPSAPPAVIRDFVLVPEGRWLQSYGLADGAPGPRRETAKAWTAEPVADGRHLLIGDSDGNVEVLDPDTLELRCRIFGGSALRAPPAVDGEGRVVLAFEGRQILGFSRLP